MKKVIITLLACMIPFTAIAHGGDHWRGAPRYEHRRDGVNPWPFIAGAVVGGIIISEVSREREYRPTVRYVTVCEDIPLYDSYGRYVRSERQCRKQLVEE